VSQTGYRHGKLGLESLGCTRNGPVLGCVAPFDNIGG
jgi:hypothetical protein